MIACRGCRFFEPHFGSPLGLPGVCRRRAPKARTGWPRVRDGDWCGEFEEKLVITDDVMTGSKPTGSKPDIYDEEYRNAGWKP